jgi:hypothetical protein
VVQTLSRKPEWGRRAVRCPSICHASASSIRRPRRARAADGDLLNVLEAVKQVDAGDSTTPHGVLMLTVLGAARAHLGLRSPGGRGQNGFQVACGVNFR